MKDNGYSPEATQAVWDVLLPFSAYGFNKSHTAGYGLVSYWTAYLKANYPAEYMAALLTSVGTNKDKMAVYLAETRRMGVKVLPPDVNESQAQLRPRRGPTSGSGSAPSATSAPPRWSASIESTRTGQGRLHLVRGLPGQVPRSPSATSGSWSR